MLHFGDAKRPLSGLEKERNIFDCLVSTYALGFVVSGVESCVM